MVTPTEPDEEDDGEREYVSPDHSAGEAPFKAIRDVATLFGDYDSNLAKYCDWSQANANALVEEFSKRAKPVSKV